jgi:predicted secreted protein
MKLSYHNILFVLFIVGVVVLLPDFVLAQGQTEAFGNAAGFAAPRDPRSIVSSILTAAMSLLGVTLFAYGVRGGYLIMTGGGNSDRIERGTRAIWTSALGALVILSSYGIARFVIFATDYAANDNPNIIDDQEAGFSIDGQITPRVDRPADPLYDVDPTGLESGLLDPEFYR